MATTNADIKAFFAKNSNLPPLTAKHGTRILAMLVRDSAYNVDENGDPRTPVPDDLLDWVYRRVRAAANKVTTAETKASVDPSASDLLS